VDQRTHAWIAVRAVALLSDSDPASGLATLLTRALHGAIIGAWIPDLTDAKRGGGQTQHHVFKLAPQPSGDGRFVASKDALLKRLVCSGALKEYLGKETSLGATWWHQPYRADPAPGQHVANRAMALASFLRDLLIIGSEEVDEQVPGHVRFLDKLDPAARTKTEQAGLYLFMLSHFVADASMPCHCDARPLAGFGEGLHEQLEKHWGKAVGPAFDQARLVDMPDSAKACEELLSKARGVDASLGLTFNDVNVPKLPTGRDVWLEIVDACRASFALSALIAPPSSFDYRDPTARAPFDEVLGRRPQLLHEVDRVVLTDAVVNTATMWSHVWSKVAKPE
jgi:hypothetical protein